MFWRADDDDDGGGDDDDVTNLWEQEGAGSPVSKLHPDGESHNWAPIKCPAD